MLGKRIIACLDVRQGRVVKGVNFVSLKDAGDPVELAALYNDEGIDELVFLNIAAAGENREAMLEVVAKAAQRVFLPLTVGGGINNLKDIDAYLKVGADKVSINSAGVRNPGLIREAALSYGSQCIIVAVDARRRASGWEVVIDGGRQATGIDVTQWVQEVASLGAGEILLTSIDRDGTNVGYDIELTRTVVESVSIPVIASGGAGSKQDFLEILTQGRADAALAASLFHYGTLRVAELKEFLDQRGVSVRV